MAIVASNIVKYWGVDSVQRDEWPCCCSDPAHAYEGEEYVCSHGRWLIVQDQALAERQKAALFSGHCFDLGLASDLGLLWGDLMMEWESRALQAETPAQKAARLAAEAKRQQEFEAGMVQYHVSKCQQLYKDKNGQLKKMVMKPCKWFCHDGVLGKATPGGKGWKPGCQAHYDHSCPWVHPDQPEWQELMKGTSPASKAAGRNFEALKGGRKW